MSLSNNSINHFLYLAAVILLLSCAAVMAPPGGPKDITPPELIETSPPDGSINYAGNQIVLEFSEYIDERSIQRAIHILPTLPTKPELIYKGKRVYVDLPDSLLENQTYIVVINRNLSDENKVKLSQGIQVAFSTGDQIDQGSISGQIYYSKSSTVHLWKIKDQSDSLEFYNRIPDYAIDASDEGYYEFKFLSPGKYRIAAVDQMLAGSIIVPERMIYGLSWLDVVELKEQEKLDNINIRIPDHVGAIEMTNAEFVKGSWGRVTFSQKISQYSKDLFLSIMNQDSSTSNIKVFNDPLDETKLNFTLDKQSGGHISVMTPGIIEGETVIIDSGLIKIKMDTTQDTSNINILQPNSKYVLDIESENIVPLKVVFSSLVESNVITVLEDSISVPVVTELESPIAVNLIPVENWKPRSTYTINIEKNMLIPLYGRGLKDSLTTIKFKTSEFKGFGRLTIFTTKDGSEDLVAKLTKMESDQSTFRILVNSEGMFNIERLPEGNYSLLFFKDQDNNEKYSSGNISPYKAAEWFYDYPDTVKIRANWELELDTIIMDNNF